MIYHLYILLDNNNCFYHHYSIQLSDGIDSVKWDGTIYVYDPLTIISKPITFVSENDLWSVKSDNMKAVRLTSNLSSVTTPLFSPNGKWIAYVGFEDGNTEVY